MASKNWIAAGTASVLGIGVIAGGAIGVASAMPLVDSTSASTVPPLSSTASGDDLKQVGGGDVSFEVVPSTPAPTPTTSPAPSASEAPAAPAPAPAPQPVAPAPAPAPAPPATEVDSPPSVDDDDAGDD